MTFYFYETKVSTRLSLFQVYQWYSSYTKQNRFPNLVVNCSECSWVYGMKELVPCPKPPVLRHRRSSFPPLQYHQQHLFDSLRQKYSVVLLTKGWMAVKIFFFLLFSNGTRQIRHNKTGLFRLTWKATISFIIITMIIITNIGRH